MSNCPTGFTDREDRYGKLIPGEWRTQGAELRSIHQAGSNMYSKTAAHVRDSMKVYFNSSGVVPWQNTHVNST